MKSEAQERLERERTQRELERLERLAVLNASGKYHRYPSYGSQRWIDQANAEVIARKKTAYAPRERLPWAERPLWEKYPSPFGRIYLTVLCFFSGYYLRARNEDGSYNAFAPKFQLGIFVLLFILTFPIGVLVWFIDGCWALFLGDEGALPYYGSNHQGSPW